MGWKSIILYPQVRWVMWHRTGHPSQPLWDDPQMNIRSAPTFSLIQHTRYSLIDIWMWYSLIDSRWMFFHTATGFWTQTSAKPPKNQCFPCPGSIGDFHGLSEGNFATSTGHEAIAAFSNGPWATIYLCGSLVLPWNMTEGRQATTVSKSVLCAMSNL